MAQHEDIFISYAREDREIAERLRTLFNQRGWSVYLDTAMGSGQEFPAQLELKLKGVKCILVLWSRAATDSTWVRREANYALSRGVLAAARLETMQPPFEFRQIHYDDLSNWNRSPVDSNLARLFGRVAELIDIAEQAARPMGDFSDELAKKRLAPNQISVSDIGADKDRIVEATRSQDAKNSIEHGYQEIEAAQKVSRLDVDDDAPLTHYRSAAQHFETALIQLGGDANTPLHDRNGMPISYFLKMERANALVFGEPRNGYVPPEAMEIYSNLAKQYPEDTAVYLRMGQARVRQAKSRDNYQAAIRDLNQALSNAPGDGLVSDGHWVYFEAPVRMGVCFWQLSELPDKSDSKRIETIKQAINSTEPVIRFTIPPGRAGDFASGSVLWAIGNTIFYKAHLYRLGIDRDKIYSEVNEYIEQLLGDKYRNIYEKQVKVIDSLAFAAATTGSWNIAGQEAERNVANFRYISTKRALDVEEREMRARAHEIAWAARNRA